MAHAPSATVGVVSCHPPLLFLPPGVWGHVGNPWGRPHGQGNVAAVDGGREREGRKVWPSGAAKVASRPLPFVPSSPWVGRHVGKLRGRPCEQGGSVVAGGAPWWPGAVARHGGHAQRRGGMQGLAAPHCLGLWGTWMHPTPLGDVSDGADTSLDVGARFVVAQTWNHG